MIRVDRPKTAPGALAAGAAETTRMNAAVASDPARAGRAPGFKFENSIYGHKTVKDALWAAQHDKCAYCEGTFRAFGYGDVEHYRPKAYSQQSPNGRKLYPGYYWLAYRWENLLVSCELCNRARKKNLFPLRNPAGRAVDDAGIAGERPLLIDPAGADDPRDHIGFRGAAPEAKTEAGRASIQAYFLDRPHLTVERARHLDDVALLKDVVALAERLDDAVLDGLAEDAKDKLARSVMPDAKFSSMTRDYLGV